MLSMHAVSVTLHFSSPFHPTSSTLFFFFKKKNSWSRCCTPSTISIAVVTLRILPERTWSLMTSLASPQVMSPRTTISWRLVSSPLQSPWPRHSSPSNGSSRMWFTLTPRSRRCFITHTEYMSITPSDKACLMVSRRPCRKERGDLLLEEQGDLLWKEVMSLTLHMYRFGLFWTDRGSKSSPSQAEI